MVARIKHDSALVVTFETDGEPAAFQVVPDGTRALKAALAILAVRDTLYAGDRLTVHAFLSHEAAAIATKLGAS
jgi:hypothetical protein